jgi:hypothetical protein
MKRFAFLFLLFAALPALATVYSVPGADVQTFVGLSSDTKPSTGLNSGAQFVESDTSRLYVWVGDKNSGTWTQLRGNACETNSLAASEGLCFTAAGPWEFEEVAASATDQSLGANGSTGDYLSHCYCQVTTSGANGTCGIEDGTNAAFDDITVVPASSPIGNYKIEVQAQATTAAGWEVTTGSAATMQCYGRFDTSGD